MKYIAVFITCSSKKEADKISKALVEEKLTACANTLPEINSLYWWKGKIERASEVMIISKSIESNFKKIVKRVKELHSYEVPEIIALPITAGSPDYINWIRGSVKK